jgi:hypothetical protein
MQIQFAKLPAVDQLRARRFYTGPFDCQAAVDKPMLQDNERNRCLICGGQSR